eukprot:SAG31_NODE_13329_length_876_cov_1.449163_1_plen_136_part_00
MYMQPSLTRQRGSITEYIVVYAKLRRRRRVYCSHCGTRCFVTLHYSTRHPDQLVLYNKHDAICRPRARNTRGARAMRIPTLGRWSAHTKERAHLRFASLSFREYVKYWAAPPYGNTWFGGYSRSRRPASHSASTR